jgi:hypothetical protein
MPMILPLALAFQAATLTSDPLQAPLICSAALVQADTVNPRLFKAAVVSYLLTRRAAANPAGGPLFEQLQGMKANGPVIPKDVTPEQAKALAPLCDKRYPQARRNGPVKLPADGLARDAACLFSLSTMGGAAGSLTGADPAEAKRYTEAAQRFATSFDTRLAASSIPADKQNEHAVKLVVDSLNLGNAYIVSQACLALPPA